MISAIQEAWGYLANDLFLDGFLALLVASMVLPPLGTVLALRRMPFVTIAVPALAGAGVTFAFWLWPLIASAALAGDPPPTAMQIGGALAILTIGLVILAARSGPEAGLETSSALLFLLALAMSQLLLVESPYEEIAHQWGHPGRTLSMLEGGRNRVILASIAALTIFVIFRRELWLTALDREFGQLAGLAPKRWLFATLVWIGAACAFLVPELGPEVVLSLLLIPGTLIRPVATTLGMHSILSGAIGAASVIVAFVLSTSMNWPVEPTITVVLIGLAWSVRQGGRWIFPSATSKQSPLPAERP